MRIDVIDDAARHGGVAAAWDALATAASTPNIFHERWVVDPSRMLPESGAMRLLLGWGTAADGSARLDAVLPVATRRVVRGLIPVAVENWDQRVRALGEPLIRAGQETAFWHAALTHLDRKATPGSYLRLSALIADSPSTLALLGVLGGRDHVVTRRYGRAILRGGPTSADYIAANIRAKVLKEHRRLRNRLADQGAVVFERLAPGADPHPWIDDLFRLEMTGWKGREGVAAAAATETEAAFRAIIATAHTLGRLDFHRLTVGGKVLSMLANIEAAGNTAYQLKIAFDEDYASFSPGVLIEMAYLDHALDHRRLAWVDSCARAGHPMIDRIWIDRLPIVSLAIPFANPLSRAVFAGQAWLRRRKIKTATIGSQP